MTNRWRLRGCSDADSHHDGTSQATKHGAREALRRAILAYRHEQEASDEPARDRATVPRGPWTLVDAFRSGGRHFVVAVILREPASMQGSLTPRERDVLTLAARGLTNKVIAYDLGLASSTVRVLMSRARVKLGARSRTEAVRIFVSQ